MSSTMKINVNNKRASAVSNNNPSTAMITLALLSLSCLSSFPAPAQALAFTLPSQLQSLRLLSSSTSAWPLEARRRRDYDEDEDDYYYDNDKYYDDDDEDYFPSKNRNNNRNSGSNSSSKRTNNDPIASPFGTTPTGMRLPETLSQSILAGVFILGIGTGVTVDSQINTSPKDLASRDAVDQAAPNPTLCTTYGASAMAFDQRVFVSFNPFNVYVAQADVKPACVLRPSNVVPILQDKGLINSKEVKQCKANMSNTWAFVGDLGDYPQLSCVYKSEDAQNEFLSNPKYGIGEDVYDDDREALETSSKRKQMIKTGLTDGEKAMKAKVKNDILLMEKDAKVM